MTDSADTPSPPSSVREPRVADEPFNDTTADVILRTSDKVDFYVYKNILSLASPFFKDMFCLPQSKPASDPSVGDGTMASHPIIDVSEDARTMNLALRFCYPMRKPTMTELKDVGPVLLAACKYDMDTVFDVAKVSLAQSRLFPPAPQDADVPFHDKAADIILRSSDHIDFHTHSVILSFASPVFKDMILSHQKADAGSAADGNAGHATIINVSENSRILNFVLRRCYPAHVPPLTQLNDAHLVLAAGVKYGIDIVRDYVATALIELVDQDILGVLSIALRYRLNDNSATSPHASITSFCAITHAAVRQPPP
ncbi:hypothetical protein EWM64_g6328 [Hericium alpestre]|uniref:BTB domain-containing protein n=1 Tax=Hericium alpestre TaxID=135208 RepID=A0A4Y9ZTX3_9AGAM|nr:hypothetical protein EWM64_g6328 [Hericium alpestre]